MSGFPERRRALVDTAFATFGEDAIWDGAPVRVRFKQLTGEATYGAMTLIGPATVLRCRGWEVLAPEAGQIVELAAGANAGRYVIAGEPLRDGKGVWTCRFEGAA